jgi:hypothetical protein
VKPMLESEVYRSVAERPIAGWKMLVAVYLGPSHLHLEPAGSEPMPLCWSERPIARWKMLVAVYLGPRHP